MNDERDLTVDEQTRQGEVENGNLDSSGSVLKQATQEPGLQWKLDDFEMEVTLGTGSFGRVRFSRFKSDRKKVCAIKMLKKCEIVKLNQVEHLLAEKVWGASCLFFNCMI